MRTTVFMRPAIRILVFHANYRRLLGLNNTPCRTARRTSRTQQSAKQNGTHSAETIKASGHSTAAAGRTQDCTRPNRHTNKNRCNAGAIHTRHDPLKAVVQGADPAMKHGRTTRFKHRPILQHRRGVMPNARTAQHNKAQPRIGGAHKKGRR